MRSLQIYLERKIQAIMQDRLGPLHTGPWGLLQTFADAIKLLGKEDIRARLTDKWFFLAAPSIVFSPMLASYAVIPFAPDIVGADLSVGLLYLTTLGSMTVLGIVIAGWASNNKYSLIGGLRSAGQLISYEVPQILSLVTVVLVVGTLSMVGIANSQPGWQMNFLVLPFAFVTYFIAGLAETNRNPFDLPEAESELVAGFLTEYSGMRWAHLLPRRVRRGHGRVCRSSRRCGSARGTGPFVEVVPAARRAVVHAEDVLLRPRLHVDPRDAAAAAHRPAHVASAGRSSSRLTLANLMITAILLLAFPHDARAGRDRELDPARRLRARAAVLPAPPACRAPRAASDGRGLVLDIVECRRSSPS